MSEMSYSYLNQVDMITLKIERGLVLKSLGQLWVYSGLLSLTSLASGVSCLSTRLMVKDYQQHTTHLLGSGGRTGTPTLEELGWRSNGTGFHHKCSLDTWCGTI